MRSLLQDMGQAIVAADHDRYLGMSETLNMLMQQHNVKEENMLYPMSDQVLGDVSDELIRSMDKVTG